MRLIKNIDALNSIIEKYYLKSTITNNYLLASAYQDRIDEENLFLIESGANAFLLTEKEGYFRLYYYLNDYAEKVNLSLKLPCTIEIIYRGEKRKPTEAITFWENNGFKAHLTRDNMMGLEEQLNVPDSTNNDIQIEYAVPQEISFVHEQLLLSIDKYTGDQMNVADLMESAKNNNILIAKSGDASVGFLRFYLKNQVYWLGHIVVSNEHRGKGIANKLVKAYIEKNSAGPKTRYSLWVIQDNIGAVKLYEKFGFKSTNKSCISLLKL